MMFASFQGLSLYTGCMNKYNVYVNILCGNVLMCVYSKADELILLFFG